MSVRLEQDELLQQFGSEIAGAAEAMIAGSPHVDGELPEVSIAPLRRLQEQTERYLRVARSPRTRLLCFMLSAFLQDVFYNLLGDVPYGSESDRCRQQFFVGLANDLLEFSSAIANGNTEQWLSVCERMVSSYFETVTKINDLLDQE